ncbi:MAG: helix-turn-helix transcriptional regulator [Thermodesulfovibrionales bacterium]
MAKSIGNLVRELRKAAGMTQSDLATRLGITYQQVQKYENGTSKFSVPRLKQVAEVFGLPLKYFVEPEPGKAAEPVVPYRSYSDEEDKLVDLFRSVKGEKTKDRLLKLIEDIADLSESCR